MKMFRQKIEPACCYCSHSFEVADGYVNCTRKKLTMGPDESCSRFQYDPLKRVPTKQKALDFSKYEQYDYSL